MAATAPIYDALVKELGDVPEDLRTTAEQILRDLERNAGLSRALIQLPAPQAPPWFS